MRKRLTTLFILALTGCMAALGQETLPPLDSGMAPQTYEALWADFDPRVEPLDIEVLKEWEEDGVVLKVLRYRIGIFKGQKAMMAAVYGYPKGGKNLPGLLQIHGGGQYADYRAPLANAKRGYATISISWAGRINAPGHKVNPEVVRLFFDVATNDPNYKLTTDWGVLDGYHAPSRHPGNQSSRVEPASWTFDAVESPRNSPWFLWTLGARRALTFLEQQPVVDPEGLGVYGHSMGGKITVLTAAADVRVKAAAPSCGGVSGHGSSGSGMYRATLGDHASLKRISCPIIFLSPANDFHGRIDDLQEAVKDIQSKDWRVTCSPHRSHQDTPPYEAATLLWFDQYLKKTFSWLKTPVGRLELNTGDGVPSFVVTPDRSQPILSLDVFYTQQGQLEGETYSRENTKSRFWRHAVAEKDGDTWTAKLPVFSTDKPLWVYANVAYPLEKPVTGAGYYYSTYTAHHFNLSSLMPMATPEQLGDAGVQATLEPSLMIETFADGWEKEWFTYKPKEWARSTHKVYDDQYAAPPDAKLAIDVRSEQPNTLVVKIDEYAAEVPLSENDEWHTIVLTQADFQDAAGDPVQDWAGIRELCLGAKETLRRKKNGDEQKRIFGADWKGDRPAFRKLRWTVEE